MVQSGRRDVAGRGHRLSDVCRGSGRGQGGALHPQIWMGHGNIDGRGQARQRCRSSIIAQAHRLGSSNVITTPDVEWFPRHFQITLSFVVVIRRFALDHRRGSRVFPPRLLFPLLVQLLLLLVLVIVLRPLRPVRVILLDIALCRLRPDHVIASRSLRPRSVLSRMEASVPGIRVVRDPAVWISLVEAIIRRMGWGGGRSAVPGVVGVFFCRGDGRVSVVRGVGSLRGVWRNRRERRAVRTVERHGRKLRILSARKRSQKSSEMD